MTAIGEETDDIVGQNNTVAFDDGASSPKNIFKKTINYFPRYKLNDTKGSVISTDERLDWPQMIMLSLQHFFSLAGGTILGPLLMGFSTNTGFLFSGIGTLLFYLCTGGRLPSFLGPSFAFIGVVNAATGFKYIPGGAGNQNIPVALGGFFVCGLIYLAISIIVMFAGAGWLEVLTPPVVTGTVIFCIGLNLSGSAIAGLGGVDAYIAFATVIAICLLICYAPPTIKRIAILVGGLFGYFLHFFLGLGGIGPGIDFSNVEKSVWFDAPPLATPVFEGAAISLIAPIAIILAAENIGHVRAVGSMTNQKLDHLLGRAFFGDSLATIIASVGGGMPTTTYAENIGVMSVTRVYSTLPFIVCSFFAIFLGFFSKFGAVIQTIPTSVFSGLSIILFGMVGLTGARTWIEAQVDFKKPRNLLTAGICITLGCGMNNGTMISWGVVKIDGIGVSTLGSILLYQLLRDDWKDIFTSLYCKLRGRKISPDIETTDQLSESDTTITIIGMPTDDSVPPPTTPITKEDLQSIE
ncbi:hypothetical protein DFA_01490 [Cavenderia fasciculata]|uniref:Xanthine/uracil permease family protein n=1 Tax=Cavenderia fasciculata TaxID=261658 RepID=F4PT28_CACFS|nr:uncharacterized protein DFA_01490 [Cavenderia fasciculata]EGG21604.1 hypothetical protein DFA_01490 [Cavenderia fasciculata]|eukprot:XP_004359454.1 hypothetical protein DFA_01490 [Cavenderia fasciculata]